jgi:hypothetical protein
MPDRDTYNLVITPAPPRPGEAPVEVRLRKFLKSLLRDLGFRCVDIRQAEPEQSEKVPGEVEVF